MLAAPEDYPQVEERCIDHTLSRGCCWARAYVYEHLFKDQKFVLQLDSHCRLLKNWDTEVKAMRKGLEDSKAILSHYAMRLINCQESILILLGRDLSNQSR